MNIFRLFYPEGQKKKRKKKEEKNKDTKKINMRLFPPQHDPWP